MQRRQFLATAASALAWASVGAVTPPRRPLIKAPPLRVGDRVGLVNPATAAFKRAPIEIMQEALESLGLEVVLGEHFYDRLGYFAGEDEARASDINGFFADPSVRMIFARGGWGSARLLPLLDYDMIANNPKVLLGYSDATALINGVHQRTGLVTFHGPSPLDRFSARYFQRVVMAGEAVTMRNPAGAPKDTLVPVAHRIRSLCGGKAQGPLLGGNLTVLTAIIGSAYVPDFGGAMLFLEDVGEAVYRVDRMLTQLKLSGILDRVAGIVFGRCTDCGPGTDYGSLTLEEVLARHIEPLRVPAFSGSMIGHIPKQFVLPLGLSAEIDADLGTIRLLESAVAPVG
ncbi:MAG: LD-carboxypeptidase [Pseudomonadota bacterium]